MKTPPSSTVETVAGNGGLPLVKIQTPWSTAEIYLNGAHLSHFQKHGEPPLIFMSRKSYFAEGKPIRGGVPICYPWFGNREGEPSHGYARSTAWQLIKTTTGANGAVTAVFALPAQPGRDAWNPLRTEFIVTVGETLTMELVTTNESCGETYDLENCLHTYFQVGDISALTITGLEDAAFLNFAEGDTGSRKPAEHAPVKIAKETNRCYLDTAATVEVRDEKLKRIIRIEKAGSQSTVVWNPWTTQKMPDDFDTAEHKDMVCVESGNVKQNKLALAPGKTTALKVVIGSRTFK